LSQYDRAIFPAPHHRYAVSDTKAYDGTTSSAGGPRSVRQSGPGRPRNVDPIFDLPNAGPIGRCPGWTVRTAKRNYYNVTFATATWRHRSKSLAVTGMGAADKVYDGSHRRADRSPGTLGGVTPGTRLLAGPPWATLRPECGQKNGTVTPGLGRASRRLHPLQPAFTASIRRGAHGLGHRPKTQYMKAPGRHGYLLDNRVSGDALPPVAQTATFADATWAAKPVSVSGIGVKRRGLGELHLEHGSRR